VLDGCFEPSPVGVAGDLHVGGAAPARGYIRAPELTADRFVPDPFTSTPGARMYRTGDQARYHADAELECLGRADKQVKIRGIRIELAEAEAALARNAAVREVACVVREDRPSDKRLVAYWVGDDADAGELRKHLRKTLPDYMVPSAFVRLDAL